jgi:hypothetical protein
MIFTVLGWIGMVLVLLAYALLSTNKIENGKLYQILNFLAATLMAIGLVPTKAWFSFVLQIIWAIIALVALVKLFKKSE